MWFNPFDSNDHSFSCLILKMTLNAFQYHLTQQLTFVYLHVIYYNLKRQVYISCFGDPRFSFSGAINCDQLRSIATHTLHTLWYLMQVQSIYYVLSRRLPERILISFSLVSLFSCHTSLILHDQGMCLTLDLVEHWDYASDFHTQSCWSLL